MRSAENCYKEGGGELAGWSLRPMEPADLPELLDVQERGAVLGLSDVFPQDEYPFPREDITRRWEIELADPAIAAYVVTGADGRIRGFAARRDDEILHIGTAVETWGAGLAAWLHDAFVATFPPELPRLRLWVLEGNRRARRYYEKLGWVAGGRESRSPFAPHPRMLEYVRERPRISRPG